MTPVCRKLLAGGVFFLLAFNMFFVNCPEPTQTVDVKASQRVNQLHTSAEEMPKPKERIAFLIPILGCSPPWWEIFLYSLKDNAGIADFHFFFEEGDCQNQTRRGEDRTGNIFFHSLEEAGIWLATLESLREVLLPDMEDLFFKRPHKLTDYKPFYGEIFLPFLQRSLWREYTHWAWTDTDIIFGHLEDFIGNGELKDFDVVGFNDHRDELFLGGQLGIFKIEREDEVSGRRKTLWRTMDHKILMNQLRDWRITYSVDERLFSYALLQDPTVSVKIIAGMLADDSPSSDTLIPFWKEGRLYVLNSSIPSSSPPPSPSSPHHPECRQGGEPEETIFPSNGLVFPNSQPRIRHPGSLVSHSRMAGTRVWCRQELSPNLRFSGPMSRKPFWEAAFFHFYRGKNNVDKESIRYLIQQEATGLSKVGGICRIDFASNLHDGNLDMKLVPCRRHTTLLTAIKI